MLVIPQRMEQMKGAAPCAAFPPLMMRELIREGCGQNAKEGILVGLGNDPELRDTVTTHRDGAPRRREWPGPRQQTTRG